LNCKVDIANCRQLRLVVKWLSEARPVLDKSASNNKSAGKWVTKFPSCQGLYQPEGVIFFFALK